MKAYCSMLVLAIVLGFAAKSFGQQSATQGPPIPPSAQAAQDSSTLQNSQSADLQSQPGHIDAPQVPQSDDLSQPDRPPAPPQRYDDQADIRPGAATPDRSMMRGTAPQAGAAGSINDAGNTAPGELGVYLVEAAGPGVMIRQTVVGSAAAAAGLEPGDAIVRINGVGVEAPFQITRMIRAIPAGEPVTLHIWRDGQEQQITATLQPAGERYRVGFRSESVAMNGDLDSRTRRLEQQLAVVMQELRQLREEMAQLRTGPADQTSTNFGAQTSPGPPDRGAVQPSTTQPGADATDQVPTQTPPASDDTGLPF
jgi:hypothetical protein